MHESQWHNYKSSDEYWLRKPGGERETRIKPLRLCSLMKKKKKKKKKKKR